MDIFTSYYVSLICAIAHPAGSHSREPRLDYIWPPQLAAGAGPQPASLLAGAAAGPGDGTKGTAVPATTKALFWILTNRDIEYKTYLHIHDVSY